MKKQKDKRDRLTARNKKIHAAFNKLSAKKTSSGKSIYTFEFILEKLEELFPPLSRAYIQQILSNDPDAFPFSRTKNPRK